MKLKLIERRLKAVHRGGLFECEFVIDVYYTFSNVDYSRPIWPSVQGALIEKDGKVRDVYEVTPSEACLVGSEMCIRDRGRSEAQIDRSQAKSSIWKDIH